MRARGAVQGRYRNILAGACLLGAPLAFLGVWPATGTVTYALFKDKKCTKAATRSSSVSVVNGAAGPSAAVKPKVGTYYWQATYSGDGANAGSTSTCGGEILVVAKKASLLPSIKAWTRASSSSTTRPST
jgi:hypothetical protein